VTRHCVANVTRSLAAEILRQFRAAIVPTVRDGGGNVHYPGSRRKPKRDRRPSGFYKSAAVRRSLAGGRRRRRRSDRRQRSGPVLHLGVFLKPIAADMQWQRSTVSFAVSLAIFLSAVATPLLGRTIDRRGIRAVTLPGVAAFAAAMGVLATSPRSPVAFIILAALTGLASTAQAPLAYAKAISAWFNECRGLALGIAMAGTGLGAILMPQIARALIDWAGWRGAYLGLGAITFAIAFPAVALTIREPPARDEHTKSGATLARPPGVAAVEAVRMREFWVMARAFLLAGGAINGAIAHIVPLLTDRGMSPAAAVRILGVTGVATLAGRPFVGLLLDRLFAPRVATAFFLVTLASLPLLAIGSGPQPAIGAALLGLSLGAEIDLVAFLTTRYLGQRAFGEVYGYPFMAFLLGSSAGPFVADVSFDRLGSYTPALTGYAVALMAAIVLVNQLGPYVYPAPRRTERLTEQTAQRRAGGGGELQRPTNSGPH
jgi:predicted MFS family arabinose efflux permease